jgi:hypothetical protein
MNISVRNNGTNPLSTDVGLILPGETVDQDMDPEKCYGAALTLKDWSDSGLVTVTVTDETTRLDSIEPGILGVVSDGSVTTAKIVALNVTEACLAAGAVTETKLGAASVTNTKLGLLAVDSGQLAALAVTNAKMAVGAAIANVGALGVLEANINTGAVTATKIGAGAAATNIGALGVLEAMINTGAVTATKIGAGAAASNIGALGVTNSMINTNGVSWDKLAVAVGVQAVDVTIANVDILALHTTAIQVVPTTGANTGIMFLGAVVRHVYAAAAFTCAGNITFTQTNLGGTNVGQVTATGLITPAADAVATVNPNAGVIITPAAPLMIGLSGAATVGGGVLHVRVFYRVIPTNF